MIKGVDRIKEKSRIARENAHAPYSEFNVGACVFTDVGFFSGANVEYAGRKGLHAEGMSVSKAKVAGAEDFKAIAISCQDQSATPPCGSCLHRLTEFADDMDIFLDNGEGWIHTTLQERLPDPYTRGTREGHPND